jgi:hypothetical protein
VLASRLDLPAGSIAVFADPQGAVFALLWSGEYDDDQSKRSSRKLLRFFCLRCER